METDEEDDESVSHCGGLAEGAGCGRGKRGRVCRERERSAVRSVLPNARMAHKRSCEKAYAGSVLGRLTGAGSVEPFNYCGGTSPARTERTGAMRTLTLKDVENAPKRSFSAGSAIAQDLAQWYAAGDPNAVAGFLLGEKDDEERDGSDAQLRDAICILAGLKRERVPLLDENGQQVLSTKRKRPQFRDVPFSSADRLNAMKLLGIHERELSRDGTKRMVAIVRSDGSEVLTTTEADEDEEHGAEDE